MPGTQELTRRIKSVKSTRKVTRAMQMVSASKMRKAQNATLASRNYAELSWELIRNLSSKTLHQNPLLAVNDEAKKIGVILITTNRGLVGSFNSNLLALLKKTERENAEIITELIAVGRKGRDSAGRLRFNVTASFEKSDVTRSIQDIYPIARLISDQYATGEYKTIYILFNQFISTLAQKPTLRQLLPFKTNGQAPTGKAEHVEYQFEPGAGAVVDLLIPRIIESQLYQALLESNASEHSARMLMMKNATDAAGDLIDDLTLTFNQLRQNKITTELSEITAGKSALEK